PGGDTPRGRAPSAGASGRGLAGPSTTRPGGAAPYRAPATTPPPAAAGRLVFPCLAPSLARDSRPSQSRLVAFADLGSARPEQGESTRVLLNRPQLALNQVDSSITSLPVTPHRRENFSGFDPPAAPFSDGLIAGRKESASCLAMDKKRQQPP